MSKQTLPPTHNLFYNAGSHKFEPNTYESIAQTRKEQLRREVAQAQKDYDAALAEFKQLSARFEQHKTKQPKALGNNKQQIDAWIAKYEDFRRKIHVDNKEVLRLYNVLTLASERK
ncbi:hypothetical protein M011DRAFT_318481 [Sporormia fimetaria CBS 119925]|uniref:Uncharacterized protein n=1 Tax=Sporormia fimetaria CBS 119925 TaxID=1340428 RepID=A0A6A6UWG4_9PLEO|nr:hypothetical protein M011DRAFT_318481 [Sporormia fimetaria CBS 119925]